MSTVNFSDTTPATGSQRSVNVKWQSDAAGNISASYSPGNWATFTPGVSVGTATVVVTTATIDYLQIGSLMHINLNLNIAISGGVPGNLLTVQLPVGPAAGFQTHMNAVINPGTGWQLAMGTISPGVGWTFQLPSLANFPPGTIVVYGEAFYPV